MRFNVAALLKEPVGATRKFELAENIEGIDEAIDALTPLRGPVKLTRTNDSVLVEARLSVNLRTPCSRCLSEASVPLEIRFAEQFWPIVDIATGLPLPSPEDRSLFTIDDSHVLDLTEAVRQYVLVSLPIAPICRPDCAGLCPQCGHNLNEGPCNCPPATPDPRLAPLAQLLAEQGPSRRGAGRPQPVKKRRRK